MRVLEGVRADPPPLEAAPPCVGGLSGRGVRCVGGDSEERRPPVLGEGFPKALFATFARQIPTDLILCPND